MRKLRYQKESLLRLRLGLTTISLLSAATVLVAVLFGWLDSPPLWALVLVLMTTTWSSAAHFASFDILELLVERSTFRDPLLLINILTASCLLFPLFFSKMPSTSHPALDFLFRALLSSILISISAVATHLAAPYYYFRRRLLQSETRSRQRSLRSTREKLLESVSELDRGENELAAMREILKIIVIDRYLSFSLKHSEGPSRLPLIGQHIGLLAAILQILASLVYIVGLRPD